MITISILILGVLVAILGLLAAIASMIWTATQILTAPPIVPEPPGPPPIPPTPPVPGQRGDLLEVFKLGADGWAHDGWVQAGSDAHAHVLARRGLRTADELGVQ